MHCWPRSRSAHFPALAFLAPAFLALLLSLAGCARPAPAPQAPATTAAGADYGTIVAMRAVPPGDAARRDVLAALGAAAMPPDGRVEFIVRADDGQPISVMQEPASGLHTGDRVALIRGSRTRIARAAAAHTPP